MEKGNAQTDLAKRFVHYTFQHVFITGNAGTGKTTLLRELKNTCKKKMAIVSPTGVAAINAGGVTIHSFFQIPPGSFIPTMENQWEDGSSRFITHLGLLKNIRYARSKRAILQELELLIIDEVSMLRADMLDAIDCLLRHIRNNPYVPFGGVQMVYFGDLYQLPPVVKEVEWQILSAYYDTPYFFSAQVIKEVSPLYISLEKIYRQSDTKFITLLNNIRNHSFDEDDIQWLNRRYNPDFLPNPDKPCIILTTHNYKADRINLQSLNQIDDEAYLFEGEINDEFNANLLPVEQTLRLKKGAQVMFVRNDTSEEKRYFNGKIGLITDIGDKHICVSCSGDNEMIEVKRERWDNIRYVYNPDNDKLEEEVLGYYLQYPLRLAWAITIHKSQGLTFERAIIDSVDSFSAGQVYVALSRLVSLNGLILSTPVHKDAIQTDERIQKIRHQVIIPDDWDLFYYEKRNEYIQASILQGFLWDFSVQKITDFADHHQLSVLWEEENSTHSLRSILKKTRELQGVGQRFVTQLRMLFEQGDKEKIHERSMAALNYFQAECNHLIASSEMIIQSLRKQKRKKKKLKDMMRFKQLYTQQLEHIMRSEALSKMLINNADTDTILDKVYDEQHLRKASRNIVEIEDKKGENKKLKGETYLDTWNYFKAGKSIEEIATERSLAQSTIEGHLAKLIKEGKIDVSAFLSKQALDEILRAINICQSMQLSTLRTNLMNKYSYGELRFATAYFNSLQNALDKE